MAHFHIPKPLHGWREFVGEVGIIVIGVLIALAAEQLVELVHWRFETDAARQALRSEAAGALGAALFRQKQQPCVDRRLRELAILFADHAAGRTISRQAEVARPIPYGASLDAWQIEVSSQALSHMSLTDRLKFSEAFGSYDHFNEVLFREQDAWSRLRALDHPEELQDGDWPILRQAYGEARTLSARLQLITANVLSEKTLGEKPRVEVPSSIAAGVAQICRPMIEAPREGI